MELFSRRLVLQLITEMSGRKVGDAVACTCRSAATAASKSADTSVFLVAKARSTVYSIKTGETAVESCGLTPSGHDCAAVFYRGYIYTFGAGETHLADKLDCESNTWTRLPDMPTCRRGAAAVIFDDSVYVIGGRCSLPAIFFGSRTRSINSDVVEKFDLQTQLWSLLPNLSHARAYCAAVVAGRCVYVLGGYAELSVEKFEADVWSSSEAGGWEDITHMPFARDVGCAAVAVGHMVYVIGGCNARGRPPMRSDHVARLDLRSLEWALFPPPPSSHEYFPQALELDGAIYVFGGSPAAPVSMLEPWTGRWKQLPRAGDSGSYYATGIASLPALPDATRPPEEGSDDSTEESEANVIQEVPHSEEPQIIPPHEAAAFAQVQQAGLVERLIQQRDASHSQAFDMPSHEKVVLLQFGSAPTAGNSTEKFRQALLHGVEMGPCREDLEQSGFHCELPCGALMFVSPADFLATVSKLEGTELRPYHVVVGESLEYLINEMLERMPFKKRPRVKAPRKEFEFPARQSSGSDHTIGLAVSSASGQAASSSGMAVADQDSESDSEYIVEVDDSDGEYIVEVKRTFIHVRETLVEDSRTAKTY